MHWSALTQSDTKPRIKVRTGLCLADNSSGAVTLTEYWEPRVSRNLCGGLLSAALHVVLLLVVLSGGRQYLIREGDAPISTLLLLAERQPERSEIVEVPLPGPPVPLPASDESLQAAIVR